MISNTPVSDRGRNVRQGLMPAAAAGGRDRLAPQNLRTASPSMTDPAGYRLQGNGHPKQPSSVGSAGLELDPTSA